MRLVLYTGKGGVGKTTTACASAAWGARRGLRTLLLSSDSAHSLGDVLEVPLAAEPVKVTDCLWAAELQAARELERHWGSVRRYLGELFRHQGIDEVVADELALLPGADELTTLLAVEQYATSGDFDFVVVDCAPTGSTLRLLSLPDLLRAGVRVLPRLFSLLAGPARRVGGQVSSLPLPGREVFEDLDRLLGQRARTLQRRLTSDETKVRLVVTPERLVVDEALSAWTELSLYELSADAVVINRVLPEAGEPESAFLAEWRAAQQSEVPRIGERFAGLGILCAPLRHDEVTGIAALADHGRELHREGDPSARLGRSPRLRYRRVGDGVRLQLPLPGTPSERVEVTRVDDDLVVRVASRRRVLRLPPRAAKLEVVAARVADGRLEVEFAPGGWKA